MQNAFDGVIDLYLSALSSALSLSCFTETGTTTVVAWPRPCLSSGNEEQNNSLGHRHRAAFLLLPILVAAKTIKKAIMKKIPPERDIQTKQAAAA